MVVNWIVVDAVSAIAGQERAIAGLGDGDDDICV